MKLAFVKIYDLTIHFRRVETRTENEDPNLRVRNSKHTQSESLLNEKNLLNFIY